jgi:hypothetical protein
MKRAAQTGYLDRSAGEQWLTQLQVGPFFASISVYIRSTAHASECRYW